MRNTIYFLLILCWTAQAQKRDSQYFYKVVNDSTRELIRIKEFNKNYILVKDVQFKPFKNTYLKTYEYYDDGELKKNIIYYDSLKQVGVKNIYKKKKNNVTYQKTYNIVSGKVNEKNTLTITKIFDKTGNNIQTNTDFEDSKGVVYNRYNPADQIINRLIISDNDTLSILDYKYDKNGQLVNEKLELVDFNSIKIQTYSYNQSLLERRTIIINSDTIRTDIYHYQDMILNSIEVNDIKNKEKYIIEVE